jgi:hypothetical protein
LPGFAGARRIRRQPRFLSDFLDFPGFLMMEERCDESS